jgi:predicted membrane channel-forming protein YqfA (hemolysin III family)
MKKEKNQINIFIPVLAALICVTCSVAYIVFRTMSNKNYEQKWKDYDECGI